MINGYLYRVRIAIKDSGFGKYLKTMKPEEKHEVGRGRMNFKTEDGNSYVYIEAPDSVSLRASISSLTRWLVMIEKIVKEVN